MSNSYTKVFTATDAHIDELGHVNNAEWIRWVQDIATEHWNSAADPSHVERFIWVVTRHEIDYRGNIGPGESVTATTYIPEPPRGARFDRCVDFRDDAGKLLVGVRSTWAMIERESGRLQRIRPEIAEPFLPDV
ncbi:MAG: acyl-CoA thioesterase [Sphingomonadaceae bacterium]